MLSSCRGFPLGLSSVADEGRWRQVASIMELLALVLLMVLLVLLLDQVEFLAIGRLLDEFPLHFTVPDAEHQRFLTGRLVDFALACGGRREHDDVIVASHNVVTVDFHDQFLGGTGAIALVHLVRVRFPPVARSGDADGAGGAAVPHPGPCVAQVAVALPVAPVQRAVGNSQKLRPFLQVQLPILTNPMKQQKKIINNSINK